MKDTLFVYLVVLPVLLVCYVMLKLSGLDDMES